MLKPYKFLLLILLLALLLRTIALGIRPLGFTWDEAALGYNAYSLLKTGHDEHDKAFPVVFESFGDFKPGLYIYSAVPSVTFLGLTEFATRLPSAVFGVISVALVFVLTSLLWGKKYANFTAFIMAINPWAVHFSRGAWEVNLFLCLTLLGSCLFLRRRFLLSALFFGLTFWSYQGAKLFTPLLILSLFICYRPQIKNLYKPVLLLLLLLLPIVIGLSSQSGRLKVFSVFSYTRGADYVSEILHEDGVTAKNYVYYLFHSEILDQTRGVGQRYLNHFSPRFLFVDGDWSNPRHSTVFQGYFYWPEILTLLLGLAVWVRFKSRGSLLILAWLIIAPLPSALSRDIVSGVRSLPLVVPLVLVSGLGLQKLSRHLVYFPFLLVLIFFLGLYLDLDYVHTQYYFADSWLSAYKSALQLIKPDLAKANKVIFTTSLGQPYIFVLFYYRVDPRDFQTHSVYVPNLSGDVGKVTSYRQFEFQPMDWPAHRNDHSTILVGDQYELPNMGQSILYPDGKIAFNVVQLN